MPPPSGATAISGPGNPQRDSEAASAIPRPARSGPDLSAETATSSKNRPRRAFGEMVVHAFVADDLAATRLDRGLAT